MKEIVSVIRRHKVPETKIALKEGGFPALTIFSVEGRGIQKGIGGWIYEMDPELHKVSNEDYGDPNMKFIPKKMIVVVVEDSEVEKAVDLIMKTNQTGHIGDGKIFVCPLEEVHTVRTGDHEL